MRSRADGDGPRRPRVVVVGGGVAGLTAAYRLAGHRPGGEAAPGAAGARADVDVLVLEASGRAGGKLLSVHVAGGVTVEGGADSFLARKPWAVDLCRELGLGDELVAPGASGAHIWARGRPVAIPAGGAFGVPGEVATLLRWPGLSVAGRLRALLDLRLPPRLTESDRDESVGALLTRRLGREAAATMVGPLVSGIAAGDLDLLSVRASFPELAEAVRRHGSLIRATRAGARRAAAARAASPTAPPPTIFLAPSGGTARLTEALADAIGPERILLDARATAVRRAGDGYAVEREDGEPVLADAVVLAVPAYAAVALVAELVPRAAAPLTAIPYVSTASVALVFPAGTGRHLPPGTGFLFPRGSAPAGVPAAVTAVTWFSRKWPRPAFGDRAVGRSSGGAATSGRWSSATVGSSTPSSATWMPPGGSGRGRRRRPCSAGSGRCPSTTSATWSGSPPPRAHWRPGRPACS